MKELTDGTGELRIPDRLVCGCHDDFGEYDGFPDIRPDFSKNLIFATAKCRNCDRDLGYVTRDELEEWVDTCPVYNYTTIEYFRSILEWKLYRPLTLPIGSEGWWDYIKAKLEEVCEQKKYKRGWIWHRIEDIKKHLNNPHYLKMVIDDLSPQPFPPFPTMGDYIRHHFRVD